MMQSAALIILFLFHFGPSVLADGIQGSSSFFESPICLIGIGLFTCLIGSLLVYACRMDIKHWRKSIDGDAQESLPSASPADFKLPPMHGTSEKQMFSKEAETSKRTETTAIERTTQEEKTLRIVKAMYTSSNREVPPAIQKGLHAKGTAHTRSHRPTTTLQTISEGSSK